MIPVPIQSFAVADDIVEAPGVEKALRRIQHDHSHLGKPSEYRFKYLIVCCVFMGRCLQLFEVSMKNNTQGKHPRNFEPRHWNVFKNIK